MDLRPNTNYSIGHTSTPIEEFQSELTSRGELGSMIIFHLWTEIYSYFLFKFIIFTVQVWSSINETKI